MFENDVDLMLTKLQSCDVLLCCRRQKYTYMYFVDHRLLPLLSLSYVNDNVHNWHDNCFLKKLDLVFAVGVQSVLNLLGASTPRRHS